MRLKYKNLAMLLLTASLCGCSKTSPDRINDKKFKKSSHDSEMDILLNDLGNIYGVSHTECSPAVMRLIDIGESSVDRCLEIFASDSSKERIMQAKTVIVMYTARRFGFKSGFGFPDGSEAKWKQYLDSQGTLDHNDTLIQRRAVAKRWLNWRASLPENEPTRQTNSDGRANLPKK